MIGRTAAAISMIACFICIILTVSLGWPLGGWAILFFIAAVILGLAPHLPAIINTINKR
ncbi:MAG: hypothetical protein ACFFDC_00015 [Promethearchaeota archaeon]